jgi:teichuronic acid biosynthesis glycosyltransferase TuaC
VLVFPSFQEGSPNIVKQAMACNLPIVATDVGDVRTVIERTDGCIIAKGDGESFADAICTLLTRDRRTTGRQAVAEYGPEVIAARVRDVYEAVLSAHRSPNLDPIG